jgi:hypothetical protein
MKTRQEGHPMPVACYDPATGALLGTYKTVAQIYTALAALTATQKTNVWTDLTSGSPAKWTTNEGQNAGAIGLAVGIVVDLAGAMTAAQLTDMKLRAVACYVYDNPRYLVNPPFDASINVPAYT